MSWDVQIWMKPSVHVVSLVNKHLPVCLICTPLVVLLLHCCAAVADVVANTGRQWTKQRNSLLLQERALEQLMVCFKCLTVCLYKMIICRETAEEESLVKKAEEEAMLIPCSLFIVWTYHQTCTAINLKLLHLNSVFDVHFEMKCLSPSCICYSCFEHVLLLCLWSVERETAVLFRQLLIFSYFQYSEGSRGEVTHPSVICGSSVCLQFGFVLIDHEIKASFFYIAITLWNNKCAK